MPTSDLMQNSFIRKINSHELLTLPEQSLLRQATEYPRRVGARRDLIREGDKPGPVFVILDGWACRYKILANGSRQILAFMMPGDMCDMHVGVLDEMDHSIGTITPCRVAIVPRKMMETLITATPNLTHAFWRTQLVDEGVLRAWIVSMGRRDSLERIAHLVLELYVRMRHIGLTSDDSCDLPISQILLADALGLTPVHINRILRSLREREVITIGAKKLSILKFDELARIAGFDDNYLHRRTRPTALAA